MSMSKPFLLWSLLAISGLVMAWLSFSLSCAHFDISSMCQDMSNKVTGDSIPDYSFNNCFRLADLSKVICARMQTVSWFGLFFGLGTACIATNQAIEKYVEKSWENDNNSAYGSSDAFSTRPFAERYMHRR